MTLNKSTKIELIENKNAFTEDIKAFTEDIKDELVSSEYTKINDLIHLKRSSNKQHQPKFNLIRDIQKMDKIKTIESIRFGS